MPSLVSKSKVVISVEGACPCGTGSKCKSTNARFTVTDKYGYLHSS